MRTFPTPSLFPSLLLPSLFGYTFIMDNHTYLPEEDPAIRIDTGLLRDVLRRRAARILLVGSAALGAFMVQQLVISPQTFKAEASIVMQQSGSTGGLGALLGGGGGASHKYMGLLHSRALADKVESQANLKEVYGLKSHADAAARLMDGIKPEDDAVNGLLLVRLTLPAPPILGRDPTGQREKVRLKVAECANLYAQVLGQYYEVSNSDRDNVLLIAADRERREARAAYDNATRRILTFVGGLDRVPQRNVPSGATLESGSGASSEAVQLYQEQARVEADIRSAEATQQAQTRLTQEQLKHLETLPTEDYLLNEARNTLHRAEGRLKRALENYGPDNPEVRDAQDNLKAAQQEEARQATGIQEARTTDQVDLTKKLEGLRAKQENIAGQIVKLESGFSTKRGLASKMELLRNEQTLALERLKQAEVKAVEVRLSAVSGKSMITVVDEALPPSVGSPTKTRSALLGVLLALFAMALTTIWEYFKQARQRSFAALQFAAAHDIAANQIPRKNGSETADKTAAVKP